ncbi:insulin-like growth factor-binding protein complex acid labile subunit [Anopheles cruzii]|uniref:insulin-like growth factor-binding protein complex acid labile subunit n=1 Tax=Anopheles cruzii TaxID=68878 RepID=UPI0022EC3FF1|nr:insulin-like growth factor-binding protein complex acid labile subunit [Anopheles cruzii]
MAISKWGTHPYVFTLWQVVIVVVLSGEIFAQISHPAFEDSSNICDKCSCIKANKTSNVLSYDLLDCARRNLQNMLAEWPELFDTADPEREIVFSLSGNGIVRLEQLPGTKSAVVFSCRHCLLEVLAAGLFLETPNILRVDLSWNRLNGDSLHADVFRGQFDGESITPLPLDELDLGHNNITSLARDTFKHITGLRQLTLSHNPINELSGVTGQAIAMLVHLEMLDLSYQRLTAVDDHVFAEMNTLHELKLQGNQFLRIPEAVFRTISLVSLQIGENPFVEFSIEKPLPHLRHLNVSSMPWLGSIDVDSFKNANNLRTLICRNTTALDKFDMQIFQHVSELQELDLSNSNLKHLILPPDAVDRTGTGRYAKNLEKLLLQGNTWHCDCDLQGVLNLFAYDQLSDTDEDARCEMPYLLTSLHISELSYLDVCDVPLNEYQKGFTYEKPAFLRPRAIFLSLLSVGIVLGLGVIIGLLVVCLKRRLSNNGLGFTSPVRYTSVRDSTLSTAYKV